jgi:hypothetical protein
MSKQKNISGAWWGCVRARRYGAPASVARLSFAVYFGYFGAVVFAKAGAVRWEENQDRH